MNFNHWFEEECFEAFVLGKTNPGVCISCSRDVDHIFITPSQTFYENDKNAPYPLCFYCSEQYQKEMKAQWEEYYASIW
jgi:hypothetical protein